MKTYSQFSTVSQFHFSNFTRIVKLEGQATELLVERSENGTYRLFKRPARNLEKQVHIGGFVSFQWIDRLPYYDTILESSTLKEIREFIDERQSLVYC